MPSNIILKKSSVVNKVPLTTDLQFGELALNYADGKLYYKKSDGTTIDAFQAGSTSQLHLGDTAPVNPAQKPFWWDSTGGVLYVYYTDVDGSQWVPATPSNASSGGGGGSISFSPVTYTYTGPIDPVYNLILDLPRAVQTSTGVTTFDGPFVRLMLFSNVNFTAFSFTNLVGSTAANFFLSNFPSVQSLSLPAFQYNEGLFTVRDNVALTSFSAPVFYYQGGNFELSGSANLPSFSFPELTYCIGSMTFFNLPLPTTVNLPKLEYLGSLNCNGLGAVTSVSFPVLKISNSQLRCQNTASLVTFEIPQIEQLATNLTGGAVLEFTTNTANLTNLILPSTLKKAGSNGGNVLLTSCKLTQASVDSILIRLAALDGTNGTTVFSNRTVTITGTSSTPSSAGLAAKATLVARGCTVTNN